MKAGWETAKIGDVCKLMTGGTPSRSNPEYFDGPIKWLVSGDIHQREITDCEGRITQLGLENSNARMLPVNSVIIALNGQGKTRATVAMLRTEATCNQSLVSIFPNDPNRLLPEFIFMNLHGRYHEIRHMTGDAGNERRGLNMRLIRSIEIPLPPLEEQQRIVAVLDEAFDGLARARAHAEANLQNARELFENYREEFIAPSKREGWSHRKLEDLITIKHGFAFKSAFFVDQGQYAVLTPGNYHETGGFRDRGEKQRYYSGEFPAEFLLNKDDLLMAMTEQAAGLLGSCMIVPEDDEYLHNQRLGLISPKDGVAWSPEYFSQAFNLKSFRKGLSDTCSGATVRHTSPKRILAEFIPYIDDEAALDAAALEITEREVDCRNLECAYREKLQDLDDLRQSLLQKAFAGELT